MNKPGVNPIKVKIWHKFIDLNYFTYMHKVHYFIIKETISRVSSTQVLESKIRKKLLKIIWSKLKWKIFIFCVESKLVVIFQLLNQ
jgi:hypothetical protein